MSDRRRARTALQAGLAVALLLAASWAVFRHTVYELQTVQAGPERVHPRTEEAMVVAVAGEVFRLSPGKGVSMLAAGQRLLPEESVRTGRGARADVVVGGRSRLSLAESTQVTVRELSEKLHRFKLSRGRIAVDYPAHRGRILKVEGEDGAVAETPAARFGMLSTGATVAIVTESGAVRLSSTHRTVTVLAGSQAVAVKGQPPSSAEPIAKKLLLKIAEASDEPVGRDVCADVAGIAPPGTEATVDGKGTELAADGSFHVRVPASPGKTSVRLAVRDAAGREATQSVPCSEDFDMSIAP